MRARLFSASSSGIGEVVPRDRPLIHLIWEAVLFIVACVLVVAAIGSSRGAHLSVIFAPVGYVGLVAAGLALSLRTGTPNLAVGSLAAFTGVLGVHRTEIGWPIFDTGPTG